MEPRDRRAETSGAIEARGVGEGIAQVVAEEREQRLAQETRRARTLADAHAEEAGDASGRL